MMVLNAQRFQLLPDAIDQRATLKGQLDELATDFAKLPVYSRADKYDTPIDETKSDSSTDIKEIDEANIFVTLSKIFITTRNQKNDFFENVKKYLIKKSGGD